MPFVDVSILSHRLTPRTRDELVARLTDAVVEVFDESVREHTWVVLRPVPAEGWGIAGARLGSADRAPGESPGSRAPTT